MILVQKAQFYDLQRFRRFEILWQKLQQKSCSEVFILEFVNLVEKPQFYKSCKFLEILDFITKKKSFSVVKSEETVQTQWSRH